MLKYIEALKHGKHGWFGLSWRSFLFQTSGLLEVRFLVVRFQSFPGGSYPEKKWGNLELFPKVRTWGIRPYFDTILDAVPYVHMCFLILYFLHLFFFWMKIDDDMNNIGVCWQNIMMKPYKCLNLSHFWQKKHYILKAPPTADDIKILHTLRWNNLIRHNDINWLRITGSSVFFVILETSRFKAKRNIYIYIILFIPGNSLWPFWDG